MVAPYTWPATSAKDGVDVTIYYTNSASVTPETPAPPFALGDMVQTMNGAEFVFVQASTSIALGDFLQISNAHQASSLTSTNVVSTLGCRIGMAGTVLRQSATLIPANAYFWAAVRGANMIASVNSVACLSAPGGAQLYSSATAGAVTSVSATTAVGILGVECIASCTLTTSGGVFYLTWPRTAIIISSTSGSLSGIVAQA